MDDLELSGLLDRLCKALVEDEEAAAALQNVERSPWGHSPDEVCCVMHEPGGNKVVRWGDVKPLALARRERAQRELDRALAAVYEAAGEDLDPSLVDSLFERVREEAEASRALGAMEDYAEEHEASVSSESYRRAKEDLDRAIHARENAQTEILAYAEEHPRAAPPPPAPAVMPVRPRTAHRSARSRAVADSPTTTATADGDPPAAGDVPPPEGPAPRRAALEAEDPRAVALLVARVEALERALAARADAPARFVPSASQLALWQYLLRAPVAKTLDVLEVDLGLSRKTVVRDRRVLEAAGIIRRLPGGALLVLPLARHETSTVRELRRPRPGASVSA